MINELYSLYQGLVQVGEEPQIKHKDIQSPGMGTTFRVLLDEQGGVESICLMTKGEIANTWSLGNGNKNMFPAAKLTFPLLPDGHKAYLQFRKEIKKPESPDYVKLIQEQTESSLVDLGHIACWPSYRSKILERFEQLEGLSELGGQGVLSLFQRYFMSDSGVSILEQVAQFIFNRFAQETDKETLKGYCDILFGEVLDAKGVVTDGKRVTFIVDCRVDEQLEVFASSRRWVRNISNVLFEKQNKVIAKFEICSVTNDSERLVQDTFPSEKLSVVGSTILFAKNASTSGPTVMRYGKGGADAFKVSQLLVDKLAASIARVCDAENEHRIWSKIASVSGSSPSLMVAFCPQDSDFPVAETITGKSPQANEDFEDYQYVTQRMLASFRAKELKPGAPVNIAEFIALDKANRKINYATTSSVEQVLSAAQKWQQGCRNHPSIKLKIKLKKSVSDFTPWGLAPTSFIEPSKKLFIRNAQAVVNVPGMAFSDVMKLFLFDGERVAALAKRWLVKLASQNEKLFEHCALANKQASLGANALIKQDFIKNKAALNMVTIFAVLLDKFGLKKEIYMNDFPFQLGQLCSAMDEIHIGYCKDVRNGKIPNGLIGNQTYGIALQNPVKAMGLLADRLKPYKSWIDAKRATYVKPEPQSSDEKQDSPIGRAVNAHIWLQKNSPLIGQKLLELDSRNLSETYKAQLMLGYLSGRAYEKNSDK